MTACAHFDTRAIAPELNGGCTLQCKSCGTMLARSGRHYCARCDRRPCECPAPAFDPEFVPLEHERAGFEAYVREVFPHRDMTRWGHTYKDEKVRHQWIGWQAKARRIPVALARRA